MTEFNHLIESLFEEARSHAHWLAEPVSETLLRSLYERAKWGPTSMNSQPMRLQFVVSQAAKQKLVECINVPNRPKALGAPVTVIVGQDLSFPETLATQFPHKTDALSYYEGKPELVASTALRNSSLQGGYLIMAARSLGLDCGPMSGFDNAAVDRAFWAGTTVKTNFLCNLGHGDPASLHPRGPRLSFDQVCRFV
ncbi:malonic semialdehyde reductase [Hydrogenophaga sp. PAMC20947]|uniref:malonic semialdehyde reductase n=1 Tax=Hydrogenophaga sp. PAMC20947 TaxID=2565558 RepID=UPI00109DA0DA|nr:malonic semialdehyde reductase [Hydrogenophaga sp. PAMC20947]QCB46856.1 malonic semialdehyde reductase [Hydrogenophaga sp. PAMC20947]